MSDYIAISSPNPTTVYPSIYFHRFHGYYDSTLTDINELISAYAVSFQTRHLIAISLAFSLSAFHVPIILSLDTFRCFLWAYVLDDAYNIIRSFINTILTKPHTSCRDKIHISMYYLSRPVRSEVRQVFLPFSPWVSDTRHVGGTIHLWIAFVETNFITVSLCRLYRAFDYSIVAYRIANRSISGNPSRRYPVIWFLGLSVLLWFYIVPNLFS